jgi:type III restriction enzyme
VKDDGRTGHLFGTVNTDKVRTEHREYRSVLMVFRNNCGQWYNVAYRADLRMHQPGNQFTVDNLVWTQR